jgi:hypothetical protein
MDRTYSTHRKWGNCLQRFGRSLKDREHFEDKIKMDFEEGGRGDVDWIHLAQVRDQ